MVYWLSHYVLTESPFDHVKAYLFPLAVLLARGKSLAVGVMCLSNLYNHLDALHISEMEGSPYYAVVTHLNLAILQVWAWECALPFVTHARSVTTVRKCYPPSPKNSQLDFLQKFCEYPPILLKWIGVKSPSLPWVELMDREADFVWHPYVSIADGFSFALLNEDVEFDVNAYSSLLACTPLWLFPCGPSGSWARYNPHKVRHQFGYDQGVLSENLVVLNHAHFMTPFILRTDHSCLNKAPLVALLPENLRVGVLTRKAYQYWNEIAIRFNDYAAAGRDEFTFPPSPSAPINRSCHMKFSSGLVAFFAKEKIGFVAWHDEVTAWVAYAGEVLEPWKKYEPMAKARVSAPLAHGEALNAKPLAKRERPETSVDAFALPSPLPKKVCS
nr:hypothetical protein CFP56_64505 [Quercus suber]